jgi:para-nitrobenzyl esterase
VFPVINDGYDVPEAGFSKFSEKQREGVNQVNGPVACTKLGDLRGIVQNGVEAFYGLPYAAPPTGDYRFAPARPAVAWKGLRDATQHGPIAPQLKGRLAAVSGDSSSRPQSEDCLTLTICTPAADAKGRPVVVWLHGGAWMYGSGSSDQYNGAGLAREGDLVVVGVNYRLGALGWLYRPEIVDAELGLSDMVAALAWVQDNIASFGGDPARVTVMGQSAGAMSIARMLLMPEASGLFQRAIMQSAGLGRGFYSSGRATEIAEQFLHLLDIDPGASNALARLRATDVPHLLEAQGKLTRANVRFAETAPPFMSIMPATVTPADFIDTLAAAAGDRVVLIGTTADEVYAHYSTNPLMQDLLPADVLAVFGSAARRSRYRVRHPGGSLLALLADLATEETYHRPIMQFADTMAARGCSPYVYLFSWAPPTSPFRSCHNIELPFVFGTLKAWQGTPMLAGGDAAQMAELSTIMRQAWMSFIRDGSPEHSELPAWPRYDIVRRQTMCFGDRIGVVGDPTGFGQAHQLR